MLIALSAGISGPITRASAGQSSGIHCPKGEIAAQIDGQWHCLAGLPKTQAGSLHMLANTLFSVEGVRAEGGGSHWLAFVKAHGKVVRGFVADVLVRASAIPALKTGHRPTVVQIPFPKGEFDGFPVTASDSLQQVPKGRLGISAAPSMSIELPASKVGALHRTSSGQVKLTLGTPSWSGSGDISETAANGSGSYTFTVPHQCKEGTLTESYTGATQSGRVLGQLRMQAGRSGQLHFSLEYGFDAVAFPGELMEQSESCDGSQSSSDYAVTGGNTVIDANGVVFADWPGQLGSIVTGWTINPGWAPKSGGILATKVVSPGKTTDWSSLYGGQAKQEETLTKETWQLETRPES